MTDAEIPKGLRGYELETDDVMTWLTDWIDQNSFDEKARESVTRPRKLRPTGLSGDSYILGISDISDRHLHLEVLQVLQKETDLIESKTRDDGLVWYRLRSAERAE